MKLALSTTYTATAYTTFELPADKSWDDVKDWHVKWDTLFVLFEDGTEFETETSEVTFDHTDFKRPDRAEVLLCDESGFPDWGAGVVAEQVF